MLNARDNQFLKEINMLKDLIDAEMLRQLKDYKDGKDTTDVFGKFTVEDYKEKMDNINGIINAVNDKDYSLLRSELPKIEKFIGEIKICYSGFKQTMEELERRLNADPYEIDPPRFKTHSFYQEKAENNLEELFSLVEKEIEKYKSVCSNMNLEEIKTQDYKYRKLVLYSSTLDIILSSVLDDNTSYAEGSVVDNIGELISYVRQNYPDYLEDLLWFYNIFMNKDQVKFLINKYNFPFTIKSLETNILRPYQEISKCFEKCIEEYTNTNKPSDLLKERINDLRVVLNYLEFALS